MSCVVSFDVIQKYFGPLAKPEDYVVSTPIYHQCVMHKSSAIRISVTIGENCLLGANTKVEDGVELCDNVIVLNNSVLNTYCKIGVGCVVGAGTILSTGVVVKDHVKIGNFVNIGPGAIISENVPDFSTVFGKSLPF